MALSINKNWLLLAGAIALGGVAFFLSNKAIQSRIAQLEEEATRGKTMQRVVVANKLLRAGEMVDSTVVSVREMPADFVNKATVLPETYDTVDGQVLQVDVQRGEPLLTNYTVNRGGAVFAAAVKEGRRALTIEVDEISSISGMLRPGDRIDLMLTAKPSQGGMPTANAKDMTFPMLSNVEVLATGQAQKARPADGEDAAQGYSHITLDVTPEEGTRIIAAKTAGRLTAVLRNPADKTANNSRALSIDDVVAGLSDTDGTGANKGDQRQLVEFIIGGTSGASNKVTTAPVLEAAPKNSSKSATAKGTAADAAQGAGAPANPNSAGAKAAADALAAAAMAQNIAAAKNGSPATSGSSAGAGRN